MGKRAPGFGGDSEHRWNGLPGAGGRGCERSEFVKKKWIEFLPHVLINERRRFVLSLHTYDKP